MRDVRLALRGERASEVPCGTCTACCTSSQFVHVAPDEADALAAIPAELLFPAPGLPAGHVLMGYDRDGRCPMLGDAGCTIYASRPRTCRTYDCRVFSATGVDAGAEGKPAIAERAAGWRFSYPRPEDRLVEDAVRAAAAFLTEHRDVLRDAGVPPSPTQLAVAAVEVHEAFLAGERVVSDPEPEAVLVRLRSRR